MGAYLCSQFLFISCQDSSVALTDVEQTCNNCPQSLETSEVLNLKNQPSLSVSFDDSLGDINTNIPLKVFGDKAYLITKRNWLLCFDIKSIEKSVKLTATAYQKLPDEYCFGLADYYILNARETWLITRKDINYIFSYKPALNQIDTLLNGDHFIWNAYPFLGATVIQNDQHNYYLPFVKGNEKGEAALFSSFKHVNGKLIFQKEVGLFSTSSLTGWEPYYQTPYFAGFSKNAFWTTTSTSSGVIHYHLNDTELQQDELVCFPKAKFKQNLEPSLQRDQDFVNKTYIEDSYNIGIKANQTHLLKFVKKQQPYLNNTTHLKRSLNDSPWYIDIHSLGSSKVKRLQIQEKLAYFTLCLLRENHLFLASQTSDNGIIHFYKITL